MEKYKSLEEVFSLNFETLYKWRPLISVPHRMPDAAKYFVALQLSDENTIASLQVEQPQYRGCNILAFRDHTVLLFRDQIFTDEATYIQVVYGSGVLEQVDAIASEIDELTRKADINAFFQKTSAIVDSLDVLSIKKSDLVTEIVIDLANDLSSALTRGFRRSPTLPEFARRLIAIVEQAHGLGVPLKLRREVTEALS